MAKVKVSPADGRRVRDPNTMQVIEAGYEVDHTDPYWHRRIQSGDVVFDEGQDELLLELGLKEQPEDAGDAARDQQDDDTHPGGRRRARAEPAASPAATQTGDGAGTTDK